MASKRGTAPALRGGVVGIIVLVCAAQSKRVHAYSDPTLYQEPVNIGGGGGRWFTGSSADGYACDVCHTGGTGPDLAISGLPLDGFMPGARYEVSIGWPVEAQLSLVAEFTDEQRQGAGTIELPRPETTKPFERCSLEEGGGDLPTNLTDAEGGRRLFTVLDCGARSTRFRWTAPAVPSGTLWFNLGFVASNEDAKPGGDGVTLVSRALRAAGAADPRVIAQGCNVVVSAGSHPAAAWWMLSVLGAGWLLRVRRSREVT